MASYYYQYNFISPEEIYSTVKEELKSYFDSGAIDDLMFPTYTKKCLDKLGKSSYDIYETYLYLEDFEARLPDNFYSVREAWLCTSVEGRPFQSPSSFYSQAASETTIQISPLTTQKSCQNLDCVNNECDGTQCMPELIQAVYKTNSQIIPSYRHNFLLKPGNISKDKNCSLYCANAGSSSPDSFDIRDNKFSVSFRNGIVHLVFYATEYDNTGNQLIPDNYRIKEYIEHFLKYKMFETLTNQTNDETFNQLQSKMMSYKQLSDEAYIMADVEIKKQTSYQKQRAIKNTLNRFNMYELPNHSDRYNGPTRY